MHGPGRHRVTNLSNVILPNGENHSPYCHSSEYETPNIVSHSWWKVVWHEHGFNSLTAFLPQSVYLSMLFIVLSFTSLRVYWRMKDMNFSLLDDVPFHQYLIYSVSVLVTATCSPSWTLCNLATSDTLFGLRSRQLVSLVSACKH